MEIRTLESSLEKGSVIEPNKNGEHAFDAIYRQILQLNNAENFGVKLFKVRKRDRKRIYLCCTEESCSFRVHARLREDGTSAKIVQSCFKHSCRDVCTEISQAPQEKVGVKKAPLRVQLRMGSACLDNFLPMTATSSECSQTDVEGAVS